MSDPSTSAQTPGAAEVEAEVNALRVENARRRRSTLARILRVVVPLVIVASCADVALGSFVVFNSRAKQSEAKGVLKCLAAVAEGDAPDWTGEVDAADLERAGAPCPVPYSRRYVFWRTPPGVSPIVFGARVAPQFMRELGDDFWMAPSGGAPDNCFNAVHPRYLIVPERSPFSADPRCDAILALVGRKVSDLMPRR